MKKLLLIVIVLICVFGCVKDPVSTDSTNNSEIDVSLLFEKDGIKVYRFIDNGRFVYYTDARGKTSWDTVQGKTTVRTSVETVGENNGQ
jgi:hypothetical protein